ncbi:MAG: hypothetical protein ACREIJ_12790 [Nitrospiraceae bacterium]
MIGSPFMRVSRLRENQFGIAALAGCSKRLPSKAAADESTGGVASVGYVEDAFEVRTKLADFFSVLPDCIRLAAEEKRKPAHG